MRAFGFKRANAEYEWLRERMTDYNIGRISGYAARREFSAEPRCHRMGDSTLRRRKLDIRRRKPQIRLCGGREIRDTGEMPIQEAGNYSMSWVRAGFGRRRGVRRQPTSDENERRCWRREKTGDWYRRRCFRVPDLENVRYTGSEQGRRPALCDAKERVGKAATHDNMDADKFEHLIHHLATKYKDCGKKVVAHFDDASCRSRRHERWVSRVEAEEGASAKRGEEEAGRTG